MLGLTKWKWGLQVEIPGGERKEQKLRVTEVARDPRPSPDPRRRELLMNHSQFPESESTLLLGLVGPSLRVVLLQTRKLAA